MKKRHIVIAVLFSFCTFCTKENPVDVSTIGDYRDSIVLDLYSYNVYTFTHYKQYYGNVEITEKGQSLLRPIDSSYLHSYDTSMYSAVIVPKYEPNRFEAWLYDSIPLISVAEEDNPEILVKAYSFSMHYFFCPDTLSKNFDKSIKPIELSYVYGYGFVIRDPIWGLGKLKIYYK